MSTSIDQQFVEFIVKSIVSNPDAVEIKRTIDEKGVLLELTVDPSDLGRVIGKRGIGAQSLRNLLRSLGTKNDARYNLKIVDVGDGPPPKREERPAEDSMEKTSEESEDETEDKQNVSEESVSREEQVEEPVEESVSQDEEDIVDVPTEAPKEEEVEEDSIEKTRRELADLDDLDI